MQVSATLTEVRADGMQKWERSDMPRTNRERYIWIAPRQSKPGLAVGAVETLEFVKGTGGAIGGHWAGWKVQKLNLNTAY